VLFARMFFGACIRTAAVVCEACAEFILRTHSLYRSVHNRHACPPPNPPHTHTYMTYPHHVVVRPFAHALHELQAEDLELLVRVAPERTLEYNFDHVCEGSMPRCNDAVSCVADLGPTNIHLLFHRVVVFAPYSCKRKAHPPHPPILGNMLVAFVDLIKCGSSRTLTRAGTGRRRSAAGVSGAPDDTHAWATQNKGQQYAIHDSWYMRRQ
jgi:hypothetical protein